MPQGFGYGPFTPRPPAAPDDPDEEALGILGIEPRRGPLPPMPGAPRNTGIVGPGGALPVPPSTPPSGGMPMPSMPAPPMGAGLDTNQGGPNELGLVPGMTDEEAAEMFVRSRLGKGGRQ